MTGDLTLLRRIDHYLDSVPRSAVRTEEIGPFTLFVQEGNGWRYYARPTPEADGFTIDDVEAVLDRQRALGQPQAVEWVVDLAPGVGPAAAGAGLDVRDHPLMLLPRGGFTPVPPPEGVDVRSVSPDDDLAAIRAVAEVAFSNPGTEVGEDDPRAFADAVRSADPGVLAFTRERLEAGLTSMVVATVGDRPVAAGSHQPVGGAAEITGVATLPAHRRRGLGAAVTSALVQDALDRDVTTVFLSADDDDVARVYARLGFRTIGRVGAAEPPPRRR